MTDILIVVKDDKLAGLLATACQDRGADAFRALGAAQALPEISQPGAGRRKWAGLLLDLGYAQGKPLALVRDFLAENPELKIVALGRNMDVRTLAGLMREGVFDFLELPPEPVEMSKCLDNFLGRLGPAAKPKIKGGAPDPGRYDHIVGASASLKKVFRMIDKVAGTDSTVMIHGESGAGKELIARAIHQGSPRGDRRLIPVNCGAIPEELLETELFGHEKGAFTNAIRTRIGRFEMADGSSIFLDEIGDMSPKLQVKLLRVLQEHEFERVGGDKVIKVDIRVIAATHVDLTRAVEEGRFREDLFYRLNVIPITMPPLRERLDDVPLLVEFFLRRFREKRGSEVKGVSREAMSRLLSYGWPGNVRELENLIERMVTLAEGDILTVEDLPAKLLEATEGLSPPTWPAAEEAPRETAAAGERAGLAAEIPAAGDLPRPPAEAEDWLFPAEGVDFNSLVSAYEERLIRGALAEAGGVKNQAARLLGLNRTTLVEKMRKKGLATEDG
ncbi:MAG: sigma-54 dependent transcriptional regulator [Candidatus Adiutrix sp.]|jgi:DNA-binding NtrC family response regulator|nr:sigma-54 dependent transcriptional regulator [Candidatus Adiutrix sp.]